MEGGDMHACEWVLCESCLPKHKSCPNPKCPNPEGWPKTE